MFKQILCRHEWSVLLEFTTESQFEGVMKAVRGCTGIDIPHQMYSMDKYLIQTLSCKKCGKLKRFKDIV